MLRKIIIASSLVSLVWLVGCSTLKVNKSAVNKVKRLAVVGFVVQQEVPKGITAVLSGGSGSEGYEWGNTHAKPSSHAQKMYSELCNSLKKSMRWRVASQKSIKNNAKYLKLFKDSTGGFQNRPPIAKGLKSFRAKGIVDSWPIERMSEKQRAQLARSLGVHAIATTVVQVKLEKAGGFKKLIGAGDFKPYAVLRFQLYDRNGVPIWSDTNAKGKVLEGTEHMLGITNMKALNKQVIKAAASSYKTLLKRYTEEG